LSEGIDRITDISEKLQFSKGTTHRLLKTLEISELVRQDPITRRYYLGPLVLNLASKPLIAHQGLVFNAFEEMKELRDVSRETVVLHIPLGVERICLEEVECFEDIKFTSGKGAVAPIYTGSAGKMLLSQFADNELHTLLNSIRLVRIGPNTIIDRNLLVKEVEKAREQGYSVSFAERLPGGASVSVPIRHYTCPVALSILGPEERFKPRMMDFLKKMNQSAKRISAKLKRS
jgi:DNA-binding IclR family transcriptional regulator